MEWYDIVNNFIFVTIYYCVVLFVEVVVCGRALSSLSLWILDPSNRCGFSLRAGTTISLYDFTSGIRTSMAGRGGQR